MNNKNLKIFFLFIICLLFFYDLGNINGLRQGTEGFYLLISQEMYEAGDLLIPRIYGEYHWSKPPFQFWLPMGFYHLFGGSYLFWARFGVLTFSFFCIGIIALWYQDELKRNWHEAFVGLIVPFYFLKYGRIFMMEAALALLSTLGVLYFYSFLNRQKKYHLLVGGLFTGLSVLVKGPVSLVMIAPPVFAYAYLTKKSLKNYVTYLCVGGLVGSLWFILSYVRFGSEFFDYFFIRENLGKFKSKSYPMRHVLQGLLIYSFPVWLLLFPILKHGRERLRKSPINWFFIISFLCFFILWFIPKQRSHHYAVPSIPLFSLFLVYNFYELKENRTAWLQGMTKAFHGLVGILLALLGIFFVFREDLELHSQQNYFLGALFTLGVWTYLNQRREAAFKFLKFVLPLQILWLFLLPLGILPVVPDNIANLINQSKNQAFISYRKPFFVKESLEKEVSLLPSSGLSSPEIKAGDLVFLSEESFKKDLASSQYDSLARWKVWKRGSNAKMIFDAMNKGSLKTLQEFYTLIKKKKIETDF